MTVKEEQYLNLERFVFNHTFFMMILGIRVLIIQLLNEVQSVSLSLYSA